MMLALMCNFVCVRVCVRARTLAASLSRRTNMLTPLGQSLHFSDTLHGPPFFVVTC